MNDVNLRAISFVAGFPDQQFQFPNSEEPWPHRADLALALELIQDLGEALALERKRPSTPINEVLREAREAAGYSLADVAKMAGISKSQLWEIETARNHNPTLNTIRNLTRALGLRPAQWFGL